jgi:hypothetical protein
MGVAGIAVVIGSAALVGGVIGGVVSGTLEHWLATPGPEPPARWRRGLGWIMAEVRRERAAGELVDGQGDEDKE